MLSKCGASEAALWERHLNFEAGELDDRLPGGAARRKRFRKRLGNAGANGQTSQLICSNAASGY